MNKLDVVNSSHSKIKRRLMCSAQKASAKLLISAEKSKQIRHFVQKKFPTLQTVTEQGLKTLKTYHFVNKITTAVTAAGPATKAGRHPRQRRMSAAAATAM